MDNPKKTKDNQKPAHWWHSFGPAIITASVVLGPGSLLVSSNIGANYQHGLLWLLIMAGLLMIVYVSMAARIGIVSGQTPCTLIAKRLGRPFATIIGINLCLICTTFQFANNLGSMAAITSLFPKLNSIVLQGLRGPQLFLITLNAAIIIFLITTDKIYHVMEQFMKLLVGTMIICFFANLIAAKPDLIAVAGGIIPNLPEGVSISLPKKIQTGIRDPMILIASLIGTTFSVGGAFYQANLVHEKGWTIKQYKHGIFDSFIGIVILTLITAIIMVTTATVIPGKPADNVGQLAQSLRPLLGNTSHVIFCIGLLAVSISSFLINAMIGGSILADALGKPPKLNDKLSRTFIIAVFIVGMIVAILALNSSIKPINLIIVGQALTVLGTPLMAATLLWLANRKDVMGSRRNGITMNILGGIGLLVVIFMAFRVLYNLYLTVISSA